MVAALVAVCSQALVRTEPLVGCRRESVVILSGETASRSGAVAESKDPYPLNFTGERYGILPVLART